MSVSALIGVSAVVTSLGVVFWNFLVRQVRFALTFPDDWGHTLLIPFLAGYLVYLNRDRIRSVGFRITWIGLIPIVLGIAWYMFTYVGPPSFKHHNAMGLGFGATLFGLLLLFCGWRAMRWIFFPLCYLLVFGITIGNAILNPITYRLQDIAAQGAFVVLRILRFDTEIAGNSISIFHNGTWHPLNVAEACSGMRMLVAFLALGVFLAYTGLPSVWQRIVLVGLAVPVAVFVNVLRVVTLGLLSLVDVNLSTGDFHMFVGLVWLVPALAIYLGMMWLLRRLIVVDDDAVQQSTSIERDSGPRDSIRGPARKAVILTCLVLLICGLGFSASMHAFSLFISKQPVSLRQGFSRIPSTLSRDGWQRVGQDGTIDEATLEALGTNKFLTRVYVKDEQAVYFHTTYYTDQIDPVPHVPDRCYVAGGKQQVGGARIVPLPLDRSNWDLDTGPVNKRTGEPYYIVRFVHNALNQTITVRMPLGEIAMRVLVFQEGDSGRDFTVAGYFFIANGSATPRTTDVRTLAADLSDQYAYYCKVECTMGFANVTEDEAVERFTETATDFLNELLPYEMWCLPDWSEVENGMYPAAGDTSIDGENVS